jgi:hypothetical protein
MMRRMVPSRVSRSASAVRAMAAVRNFNSSSSGSSTYYDSQSGMEVPINNEDEISVFFDSNSRNNKLGGPHDTKTNTNSALTMEQIQEAGFQGVLWPPPPPSRAKDALAKGVDVGVDCFTLFVDSESDLEQIRLDHDHVNLVFEYMDDDSDSDSKSKSNTSSLQKRLAAHVDNGNKTSIGLFDASCYHRDPILVASGVATLIDQTGGGDIIWVLPSTNNENDNEDVGSEGVEGEDSIIDLCQQLSYLDVAGPTIKSRLIVTAQSEYQVEECLNIGVNKFVFQHYNPNTNRVKWFGDMVEEQGKQIK